VIDNYARQGPPRRCTFTTTKVRGFFVIEGTMTIWVGGTTTQASPGSFVYGPQGVPHTILVTSPVARYLLIMDPAGFEEYVRGVSTPAERMILPPEGSWQMPDPDELAAISARCGIEELGPPGIPPPVSGEP
jgi:hypothetical protein